CSGFSVNLKMTKTKINVPRASMKQASGMDTLNLDSNPGFGKKSPNIIAE
ncbi:MAG: hypothetical protein ACJARG_000811, partial [Arcticibacterium sp.]